MGIMFQTQRAAPHIPEHNTLTTLYKLFQQCEIFLELGLVATQFAHRLVRVFCVFWRNLTPDLEPFDARYCRTIRIKYLYKNLRLLRVLEVNHRWRLVLSLFFLSLTTSVCIPMQKMNRV